jgi:hypothetical protein
MPEASTSTIPALEGLSPPELEQRRRNLVAKYLGTPGADPVAAVDDMTIEDLHELAAITSALRRRTAGPPKAKARAKAAKAAKPSLDNLLSEI